MQKSKDKLAEFSPEQLKAIEILANPSEYEKKTNEQICKDLGISVTTLWRWKQDEKFISAVNDLAYSILKTKLPSVYVALAIQASGGNVKAIELLLKFADRYIEKTQTTVIGDININIGITDEEEIEDDETTNDAIDETIYCPDMVKL